MDANERETRRMRLMEDVLRRVLAYAWMGPGLQDEIKAILATAPQPPAAPPAGIPRVGEDEREAAEMEMFNRAAAERDADAEALAATVAWLEAEARRCEFWVRDEKPGAYRRLADRLRDASTEPLTADRILFPGLDG